MKSIVNKTYESSINKDIFIGIRMSLPVCLGYIPLGIACGLLSQKAGLSPIDVIALSLFVYAGSGQFITASLLISHSSLMSIIITNFIVNLRYMLLTSTISQYYMKCKKRFLVLIAHETTDEVFALNISKFKNDNWNTTKSIALSISSHISWIIGNFLGSIAGSYFSINDMLVNFVLTSMFICLLCMQLKSFIYILCACLSGFIALILSMFFNNNLYIIIATVISATICYLVEKGLNLNGNQ